MIIRRFLFVALLTLPFTTPWLMARAAVAVAPPLEGPDRWVAFQGRFMEPAPEGESPVTGEYFQSSNGSNRLDSRRRTAAGTDVVWSTIVNTVLQRRFLLEPGQSAWDSFPLEARPGGWDQPLKLSSAVSRGEGPPFQGLRTVRVETGRLQQVLVPELNFFPVWQSRPGHTRRYSDIVTGEPAAHIFEPPPGTNLRLHDQPKPHRGR